MILLTKNQLNQFALTLKELSNPDEPNIWLFRFTLEQDSSYEYLIFLDDSSTNTDRYNLFELDLTGEDPEIDFRFKDDYYYKVYQMPDTNDTDYTRGLLVEQGKMRLLEAVATTPTYTPNTNNDIYDSSDI